MSTADILIVVASCVLAIAHIHGFIRRERAERKFFELKMRVWTARLDERYREPDQDKDK